MFFLIQTYEESGLVAQAQHFGMLRQEDCFELETSLGYLY